MERGSLMLNTTTFVGLDVHARSIKAVALDAMTGEVRSATFAYDAAAVAEWVGSLDPAAKCVYESGVTGFDLQKKLTALGVDCVVGAVSKMIKPSADRKRKWIGYIFLDDFGRTKPAFLNSTGVMYPSVECILKLLYQCT